MRELFAIIVTMMIAFAIVRGVEYFSEIPSIIMVENVINENDKHSTPEQRTAKIKWLMEHSIEKPQKATK